MTTATFGDLYAEPSRNGISIPASRRGFGTAMVNMGELFAHEIIRDEAESFVPLTTSELERFGLKEFDLLFARRSLTLAGAGRCVLVGDSEQPRTFESSIIRVRLDQSKADPRFYAYYFRSPEGRNAVETIVEQVAVAGIRSSDLARLQVDRPDLPVQHAIAEVLGTLDAKIAVNLRMAQNAESLLRAYYELDLEDTTEDGCPKRLDEVVTNSRETVDPARVPSDTAYIGLEHMPRGSIRLGSWGAARDVTSGKVTFARGDILFGRLRPYFRKVAVAPTDGLCSSDILVLRPVTPAWMAYSLMLLSSQRFIDYTDGASTGTKMPRVSWGDIARYPVSLPSKERASVFNRFAQPLLDQIRVGIFESNSLKELRDALLPSLMDGHIAIHDAKNVVEAAT
jgi:type I restriction enzyme S subunit